MQKLSAPYAVMETDTRQPTPLLNDKRHGDAWHQWSPDEKVAVVHAWASGRPLLVRGEAGCGKSQLARAAAKVLGVELIAQVIHPRFEALDLLYREDPVKRLAHAQLLAAVGQEANANVDPAKWIDAQLASDKFIDKGPIWRAMLAPMPTDGGDTTISRLPRHGAWPRAVVLIDEIDKADSDVPNALLDVLGNRSFTVQPSGEVVPCDGDHRPLVIITTNEDRELPPAFVRRCAVLNMKPDDASEAAFTAWLLARARAHAHLTPLHNDDHQVLQRAAAQVWADRSDAATQGLPTVGLAEYLDLLYSLLRLSDGRAKRAAELLDQISPFALVKQREQDQKRPAVAVPAEKA
jgi:MoxR-like ATPase